MTAGSRMTKSGVLETVFFVVFVVVIDASSLGIAPILGSATLASFLAFILTEDHLGRKRDGAKGFQ